jgi:hypothetical protein
MEDWVNWREIYGQVFGNSTSILESFLSNPLAILKHLGYNLWYLIYKTFFYFFETLFPIRWVHLSVLACVAVLWISAEYVHDFKGLSRFWDNTKRYKLDHWLLFLVLAIPSVVAGLFFQPRPHYILPLLPLFLFGVGKWASLYRFPMFTQVEKVGVGSLIVILQLFFLPDASAFFVVKEGGKDIQTTSDSSEVFGLISTDGMKRRDLIYILQKKNWPSGTRIFDASTGVSEYLGQKVVQCGKTGFELNYPQLKDFPGFLKKEKVEVILLRSTIYYDHFFKNDAHWQKLRSQPEALGWRKEALSEWGDSVLVRKPFQF